MVARWNDGTPLVVRGMVKGRNRADLNLWPVLSTAVNYGLTGDAITLVKNSLLYR